MSRRRLARPGTGGVRLALRGLWFRRSTALIVLVLATVASAASVIAPLYSRAAEESILRDTLRRADAFALSVQVSVPQSGTGAGAGEARDGEFTVTTVADALAHPAFGTPRLSYAGRGLYAPTAGPFRGGAVAGQVVDRAGVCAKLPVTSGRCPTERGEAMVANRSLELIGARVGDTVAVTLDGTSGPDAMPVLRLKVVGSFDPVPVDSSYWVGRPYFSSYYPQASPRGLGEAPPTADPVFVAPGTARAAGVTAYTVDVPVDPARVRLDDAPVIRRQVRALTDTTSGFLLTASSQLPSALELADAGQEIVRIAAPLAVTQLVLLSWWTLYLVVGSATEERSPELGLAKLRGLTPGQTRRFGLAEVVLLLLVAAPLGTVVGYLAVRGSAQRVFSPGTEVVLTWPVLLTVLVALTGGAVTATLSSRQVFRRPVIDLLRRVPPRHLHGGRRAGLVDGVVLVLAVAGVMQLVSDRGGRPSPVALLAPGMVAVAGGLLAARLLVRVARRRSAAALGHGRAAGVAGWAGVARRPGTARIASVLAVATCLLLVGVQAWSVAERNRGERAGAETGAAVVLQVRAPSTAALLAAVRAADPGGTYAMAAVQVTTSNQEPRLLAVDATRAERVLQWGPPGAKPAQRVERTLRPPLPAPLLLRPGRLEVTVDLQEVASPTPLRLTARVEGAGPSQRIDLGQLRTGRRTYDGPVPASCTPTCRLAALALDHPGTDVDSATATLLLETIALAADTGSAVPLGDGFRDPATWRAGAPTLGGPQLVLRPGAALAVQVRAPGGPFAEIVRGDSPEPLPALVGGEATGPPPEAGGVPVGSTTGLSGTEVRFRATQRADGLPRAGRDAVLVDLDLSLLLSEAAPTGADLGDQQVWLSRDDRGGERRLRAELAGTGVTVLDRDSRSELARAYAGDGAVLALRLLLVCGAAAVLVAVGALLVAAYVGRGQRAYEVAALRVVGVRRRTVRTLLLLENVGAVLVALACGAVAAAAATWVVLPALPQFDSASRVVDVRYQPDAFAGWAALGGLGLLLVGVGLVVATLQLRTGRQDRLREGVR